MANKSVFINFKAFKKVQVLAVSYSAPVIKGRPTVKICITWDVS